MDRRLMLLSLTAVAAAGAPALAQQAGGTSPGPMGQAEKDHAMKTAMAGASALMMADLGLKMASNADVKKFAQFEHDEQTTIAEILKAMDPSLASAKPDPKSADMMEKLKGTKGADFDRMFVQGQTDGHQMLLQIQEEYIKSGKNREHLAVAKLARGMIKEHLVHLGDLKKMS